MTTDAGTQPANAELRALLDGLKASVEEGEPIQLSSDMVDQLKAGLTATTPASQLYAKRDRLAKSKLKAAHGDEYEFYMQWQKDLESQAAEKWEDIPDFEG